MALTNWALTATILDSTTPLTTQSSFPVENIINGDWFPDYNALEWRYENNGAVLSFPLFAIIDLGEEKPVSEVDIQGFDRDALSHMNDFGSHPLPESVTILSAPDVGGTPVDIDFTVEWNSTLISAGSTKAPAGGLNGGSAIINPIKFIRYIKILINSTQGTAGLEIAMGLSEVQIWGPSSFNTQTTILSDATILGIAQLTSDAYIFTPVFTESVSLLSNAEISDNLKSIVSDAYIFGIGNRLFSNTFISNTENLTILSNASIEQTKIEGLNTYIAFPGSGSLSILEGENYDPTLFAMHTLFYTDLDSSSEGTIVPDLFTSIIMDMKDVEPPFGYQNYDWTYDWVAETFNNAEYLIETRTGETLSEVNKAVFFSRNLGYRFRRGHVPRYHQWRLHMWASGSGDIKFHQFTIKGHVTQAISKFHRNLINPINTNISTINTATTWYPSTNAREYTNSDILGDVDGDGLLTIADLNIMIANMVLGDSLPFPENADINQDGDFSLSDIALFIAYLSGGMPPRRKPK